MNLFSLLRFIVSHPLNRQQKMAAVNRFVRWQISTRLVPYPVVFPFTDKTKLVVKKGMTGATQNMYCGLQEFSDMGFLLHFLRPDDLFIDIGANIGSFTVLASGHVGAETMCFEPVPTTFKNLQNNLAVNGLNSKVHAHNIALGSSPGEIMFTTTFDTINHVATAGDTDTISVGVNTLDNVLSNFRMPALIKIDVEGFETEVLKGADQVLQQPELEAIIIELNGSGKRYGYNEQPIHDKLLAYGFHPCSYEPFTRKLQRMDDFGSHNTIYVRNPEAVATRLKTAPKVAVNRQHF